MSDLEKLMFERLVKNGKTEEEAKIEIEKRMATISALSSIFINMPLLHESALKCLNCGRTVMVGKCCDNRVYCKPEDRYKSYEVKKTEEEKIFSVEMDGTTYFIQEESEGVYDLSLFHSLDQAKKDIERKQK